jgi:hypothetical protein
MNNIPLKQLKLLKCTLATYAFNATYLCCLGEKEVRLRVKFIGLEIVGGVE